MADGNADEPPAHPNDDEVLESDYQTFVNVQISHLIEEEKREKPDLSHLDELNVAIRFCKNYLADRTNDESKRAEVLAKLVELKLELLQIEETEAKGEVVERVKKFRGHDFVIQSSQGRNPYCEVCLATIWRVAQYWRRCNVCGFRAHDKCVENTKRACAGLRVRHPKFKLNLNIRTERSLFAQSFQCAECQTPIAFGTDSEPRLCDYSGRYYCASCHWNDEMVIPSRMVRNWDSVKRPVCRASKQLLVMLQNKPIINLSKANPMLFKYVNNLERIQELRRTIILMKCYFMSCKKARKLRILQHLHNHQHFVEDDKMYTLNDLISISTGTIVSELEAIVRIFKQHITVDCLVCQGQGFICSICNADQIIFPFSPDVSICKECCATYHRPCFERASKRCPRCLRRRSRQAMMQGRSQSPVHS
ncbi:Differentially expressed in FDCP 8-like protein [Aphelenchoides fujianensis]|nr:Differentially expressed in FDCP 8-like protein [Aphelenchoides fujianensis]